MGIRFLLATMVLCWIVGGSSCNLKSSQAMYFYNAGGSGSDFTALQEAINQAGKLNKTLALKPNSHYSIDRPLLISCNIQGNNATIRVDAVNQRILYFSKDHLTLSNLNIGGQKAGYIQVNKNHITFDNCHITGGENFILFSILNDYCSFVNSTITNLHKKRHQFAIHSINNISNLMIESCTINGGIHLENNLHKKIGNHTIKNSTINVDYSHAHQDYYTQHDGVTLRSIHTAVFENNTFNFKNVNRGFKFADNPKRKDVSKITEYPTTNILFKNNTITSNSVNGKQLFDCYDGTAKINLTDNTIKATGHTTIFENKTSQSSPLGSDIILNNNEIFFDFQVLYVKGAYLNTTNSGQNKLVIENNKFINLNDRISRELLHTGQSFATPLNHLFHVQNYHHFTFRNNVLHTGNKPLYQNMYFALISEIQMADFYNNTYQGGISYVSSHKVNKLIMRNNTNEYNNLPDLVHAYQPVQGSLVIESNKISKTRSNFKIVSEHLVPVLQEKNNTIN